MELLLYFIFGVIFIQYIVPILDGVLAWFLTYLEVKKGYFAEILATIEARVQKIADNAENTSSVRTIGFELSGGDEIEEDDEDEDL